MGDMANKQSKGAKSTKTKSSARPKPSSPRAGFRVDGKRYGCGGKLK
jgi:hypothetical protein